MKNRFEIEEAELVGGAWASNFQSENGAAGKNLWIFNTEECYLKFLSEVRISTFNECFSDFIEWWIGLRIK